MHQSIVMSLLVLGGVVAGCADCGGRHGLSAQPASMAAGPALVGPKDGELPYPSDYRQWNPFLREVQRPDVKQVRDIYINRIGSQVEAGQPFADGSIMVMELYKVKTDGEVLVSGADGKLVKGELSKIFVMQKGDGWGQQMPDNLKNGNWVFSAFGPDGKPLAEDFTKCRACHAPMAGKDFTPRLDEYLQARKGQ